MAGGLLYIFHINNTLKIQIEVCCSWEVYYGVAYKMEYLHPTEEKTGVDLVRYSSGFQQKYKKIYNECYHEMREALDRKPYDFIQNDSFFQEGMDTVYLLLDGDEIIGSVTIKDDEIDDLLVNKLYQGQGYGKEILLWALQNMQSGHVTLHVAEWNKKAINLYKKVGFEIIKTEEF